MIRAELFQRAAHLADGGMSYADISTQLRAHYCGQLEAPTRGWAANLVRAGRKQCAPPPPQPTVKPPPPQPTPPISEPFKTYSFKGHDETPHMIPVFDGEPHVSGDWMIVGDVHLPTTDYELAARMLKTARTIGIRQLAIIGDLMNMDAYSRFDNIIPPPPFQAEISAAVQLVGEWGDWFEDILMVLGNHEHRLLRHNVGRLNADWMGHILEAARGVLRLSPYSQMVITSGGETWRATHQANYSRIPGRVGSLLAQKYQCNMITFHQHHVAKLRDTFNRYTVIDGGGLFDDNKMAYVKLTDNTSPVMARGFTVLINGTAHLITPYSSFTDLSVLLAGLSVQRALLA